MPMPTDSAQTLLNISLLAFDRDAVEATTYHIIDRPQRGTLFATSALPGNSYTQVEAPRLRWQPLQMAAFPE